MGRRNPLMDWVKFYLVEGNHDVINACQIWWRSLKGFRVGCGVKVQYFPLTLLVIITTLLYYRVSAWYSQWQVNTPPCGRHRQSLSSGWIHASSSSSSFHSAMKSTSPRLNKTFTHDVQIDGRQTDINESIRTDFMARPGARFSKDHKIYHMIIIRLS